MVGRNGSSFSRKKSSSTRKRDAVISAERPIPGRCSEPRVSRTSAPAAVARAHREGGTGDVPDLAVDHRREAFLGVVAHVVLDRVWPLLAQHDLDLRVVAFRRGHHRAVEDVQVEQAPFEQRQLARVERLALLEGHHASHRRLLRPPQAREDDVAHHLRLALRDLQHQVEVGLALLHPGLHAHVRVAALQVVGADALDRVLDRRRVVDVSGLELRRVRELGLVLGHALEEDVAEQRLRPLLDADLDRDARAVLALDHARRLHARGEELAFPVQLLHPLARDTGVAQQHGLAAGRRHQVGGRRPPRRPGTSPP